MAQQTLLTMVQNIMSGLDSGEINSISDTVESMQVARIIENKYYDILAREDLPDQEMLMQLTASGDPSLPTLMFVPDGVTEIQWIKYFDSDPNESQQVDQFGAYRHQLNTDITDSTSWTTTSSTSNIIATGTKTFTVASSGLDITVGQGALAQSGTNSMFGTVTSYTGTTLVLAVTSTTGSGTYTAWTITSSAGNTLPGYKYVTILPLEQFLDMVNGFNPSDDDVFSYTFSQGGNDFTFYYMNNKQPKYCTIIENYYILFDSYQADFDSTLQSSKSMVFGAKITPFQLVDSFVPDLSDDQFPLLLNESKSLAFFELKQTPHIKAEQEIKRQWSRLQKSKSVANKPTHFDQLPNFGRLPRTGGYGNISAYRWMRQR